MLEQNGTKVYILLDLGNNTGHFGQTKLVTPRYISNNATTGLAGEQQWLLDKTAGANFCSATSPGTTGNINGLEGAPIGRVVIKK